MTSSYEKKRKVVISTFLCLLRSGRDYTTDYMYEESAKKVFLSPKTAGDIIRSHYNDVITLPMHIFVAANSSCSHNKLVADFGKEFGMCKRESRLVIRYIKRKK
jgi:hypothetical protein